ncbi:MAG: hypothetical protein IBX50_07395 [Marinospirillum sp.]|uniref:hypothetical protein n=1 Tax=Marinospirillum sp. TaxID=2183934 RepID=UPI001A0D3377|nr:hypothetical protein [Marinospirillum sp.]MBE0506530.1 hypothetical protein [Marinospirillum sp.]
MSLLRILSGVLVLLPLQLAAASPASSTLNWRIESELQASHSRWGEINQPELEQPAARQWDAYLRGSFGSQGWFTDVRLQQDAKDSDSNWQLQVDELYHEFTLPMGEQPLEMTFGAKTLHWDYGFLAMPLNWLGPTDGRRETRHQADPLLLAEYYAGMTLLQSGCAWIEAAEDSREDWQSLCLLRMQGFAGAAEWQWLIGQDSHTRAGAGLAMTLTDAVGVYLSSSWQDVETDAWQTLVGINWSGAKHLEVRAEYLNAATDQMLLRSQWTPDDWTLTAGLVWVDRPQAIYQLELALGYQLSDPAYLELAGYFNTSRGPIGVVDLDQQLLLRLIFTTGGQLQR